MKLLRHCLGLALLVLQCLTCGMHTGTVIETTRKALKMTQKELGLRADLDHTTISRIERGVIDPPGRTVKALTDALGKAIGEQSSRGAA